MKIKLTELYKRYLKEAQFPWHKFPPAGGHGDGQPDLRPKKDRDVSNVGQKQQTKNSSQKPMWQELDSLHDEVEDWLEMVEDSLTGQFRDEDEEEAAWSSAVNEFNEQVEPSFEHAGMDIPQNIKKLADTMNKDGLDVYDVLDLKKNLEEAKKDLNNWDYFAKKAMGG